MIEARSSEGRDSRLESWDVRLVLRLRERGAARRARALGTASMDQASQEILSLKRNSVGLMMS